MSLKVFLETTPPLETRDVVITVEYTSQGGKVLTFPAIQLFCSDEQCKRVGYFDGVTRNPIHLSFESDQATVRNDFIFYRCRNCERVFKVYALRTRIEEVMTDKGRIYAATFMKIGESPRFGEPRPDLVTDVLDDEIKIFDRGYRAEREGLGIGAFAYYRRFVESHKDKIIAEIRKVAVSQSLPKTVLDALDRAAKLREFSAAVDEVKDAIPDSIKINGANPLTLLHDALSAGLHNEDDVECLSIAKDIRLVLTGLAERTSELLKGNAELAAAVTRLNQKRSGQKPKS